MSESSEIPTTFMAYQLADEVFKSFTPTVEGLEDIQRAKTLGDGTSIVINRYQESENGGSQEKLDTFFVNIGNPDENIGLSFVVTQNGLVDFSIRGDAKKMLDVSLRSVTQPREGKNLEIDYEVEDIKTNELKYREAAKPLVAWLDNIVRDNKYSHPPVRVVQKSESKAT